MSARIKYILFTAALPVFAGCVGDPGEGGRMAVTGGEGVEVTMSLYMPGTTVVTRALDEAGENSIRTIDVLGFRNDGGAEKYAYHIHGTDLAATSASALRFKAYLKESSVPGEQYRIVVLANLREAVEAAKESFTAAMTKEEVLALIKFDSDSEWSVGTGYTPLPMWGESAALQTVDANTTGSSIGTVPMMRAVARLDVGMNMTGPDYAPLGLGNTFKLTSVKIYNSRTGGYASPQPGTTDNDGSVLYPSADGIPVNPLQLSYEAGAPYLGLTGTIYVAESKNRYRTGEGAPWEEAPDPMYIVVGGYYPATGSTVSWYRIDMRDSNGDMTDILRNHRYIVNIKSISGAGYPSESEAANSKPMNIASEVTHLSGGEVKHAVFDDYYMLGVSDRKMTVGRRGDTYSASFTTDYPNGWSVRISDDPDPQAVGNVPSWISLDTSASGSGAGTHGIGFTTFDYPDYPQRTAYIHITAGRLQNCIEVTQDTHDAVSLEINPDTGQLLFMSGLGVDPVGSQTINLTWSPASLDVAVSTSNVAGYEPVVVNGLPATLSGGNGSVTIVPDAMSSTEITANPSKIRALRVDFTVTSEFGTTVMRTVMLRQRHIGVNAAPAKTYKLLGGTDALDVHSNAAWVATLEPGGTAIDRLTANSGTGSGGGEQIEFVMQTGNNSHISGVSYIVISSPSSAFDPVRVAITGYWGHPFRSGDQNLVAYPSSSPDPQKTFSGASSYCSGLGSGWRVPSPAELQAIYYRIANTASDRTALNIREGIYWSSSNKAFNYYYVDMRNGQLDGNASSLTQHYVRCIRNQ